MTFNKNLKLDGTSCRHLSQSYVNNTESTKMKIISVISLLLLSFIAVSANISDKIRSQNSEQLDLIAKQIAEVVAKELPIKPNKYSTITSIVYAKSTKTFMYFYEVVNIENPLLIKKEAVSWACSDSIMSAFMEKGI